MDDLITKYVKNLEVADALRTSGKFSLLDDDAKIKILGMLEKLPNDVLLTYLLPFLNEDNK